MKKNETEKQEREEKHTFAHRKLSVSLHISRLTAQPVFTYSFAHAHKQTNNETLPNIHTLSFRLHKSWLCFFFCRSFACVP